MNKKNALAQIKKGDTFRLAHISDLHLASLQNIRAGQLTNKRLLGYLRWHLGRRAKTDSALADIFMRQIHEISPDHIVITGDLTHLGLPEEFANVRSWLERLGPAENITVIPGNHDCYVREPWNKTFRLWQEYMSPAGSNHNVAVHSPEELFPTVEKFGDVAIIGISTAVPSALHLATGRIGGMQLEKLDMILAETGREKKFRILCMHHPPIASIVKQRKELTDHRELLRVIEHRGCELVLHGHSHKNTFEQIASSSNISSKWNTLVFGAPSLTSTKEEPDKQAAWFLHEISRTEGGHFALRTEEFRLGSNNPKNSPCFFPTVQLQFLQ